MKIVSNIKITIILIAIITLVLFTGFTVYEHKNTNEKVIQGKLVRRDIFYNTTYLTFQNGNKTENYECWLTWGVITNLHIGKYYEVHLVKDGKLYRVVDINEVIK